MGAIRGVVSLLPRQSQVEKINPLVDLTDDELEQLERYLTASRAKQVNGTATVQTDIGACVASDG
jgi:hypothetical protein